MPTETQDTTIVRQGDVSLFVYKQDDKTSLPAFKGLVIVDSLNQPLGDITPIRIPDPTQPGKFIIVGRTRAAPDLGEMSLLEHPQNNRLSLSEMMANETCNWAAIIKLDNCSRPDVLSSWQSLWLVKSMQSTEIDLGQLKQWEEDVVLEMTSTVTHGGFVRILPIRVEEKASSIVVAEVLDVIYADALSCGSCAPYSDGCQQRFALTKTNPSSAGLSGQIVFSKNGSSYNTNDVNSLAGGNGTSLIAIGQYLVVTQAVGAQQHHYALKSAVTDTPTAYNWTAVSTGYNASGGGLCSTSGSANRMFVGGQGGYVYGTDDVTVSVTEISSADTTTQNINAISYYQGNLLAVGNNNTIIFSSNADNSLNNITFSSITAPSALAGIHLTACKCWGVASFEIGSANGKVYYTVDGGLNWTLKALPVAATYINDIQYSDFDAVGAMAVSTASAGYILRSYDQGRTWYNSVPAIGQIATAPEKYNAVALCGANAILGGGKKASSTDGLLAEAT